MLLIEPLPMLPGEGVDTDGPEASPGSPSAELTHVGGSHASGGPQRCPGYLFAMASLRVTVLVATESCSRWKRRCTARPGTMVTRRSVYQGAVSGALLSVR